MESKARILSVICILTILFYIPSNLKAQNKHSSSHSIIINIPEVALLDLETNSSSAVRFDLKSPTEAGNSIDFSSGINNQVWLNYSSVSGQSGSERTVSAYIEGELPSGLALNVTASEYTGDGTGRLGVPCGKTELSNQTKNIITNIGSCYTGDGTNNGHLLTYSLELKDTYSYMELNFEESGNISVIYVLSDDN